MKLVSAININTNLPNKNNHIRQKCELHRIIWFKVGDDDQNHARYDSKYDQ